VRVEIDLPPLLGTDSWRRSAYPPIRADRRVEEGGTIEVQVPEPAQLNLEVLDSSKGEPVPRFTLQGLSATVPPVEVTGGYWQGWVSKDIARFRVVVPGLGSTEFATGSSVGDPRVTVRVGATGTTVLTVSGMPGPVAGKRLTVQILEESPAGLHGIASIEAEFDGGGRAIVDLAPWPDAWIAIPPQKVGTERMEFDPEAQQIGSREEIGFRALLAGG